MTSSPSDDQVTGADPVDSLGWTAPAPLTLPHAFRPLAPIAMPAAVPMPQPFVMPQPLVPHPLVPNAFLPSDGPDAPAVDFHTAGPAVVTSAIQARSDRSEADLPLLAEPVGVRTETATEAVDWEEATSPPPEPSQSLWTTLTTTTPGRLMLGAATLVLILVLVNVLRAVVAPSDQAQALGCPSRIAAALTGSAKTPVGSDLIPRLIREAEDLAGQQATCTWQNLGTDYPLAFYAINPKAAPQVYGAVRAPTGADSSNFPNAVPAGSTLGELVCTDTVINDDAATQARALCIQAAGGVAPEVANWLETAVPRAISTNRAVGAVVAGQNVNAKPLLDIRAPGESGNGWVTVSIGPAVVPTNG